MACASRQKPTFRDAATLRFVGRSRHGSSSRRVLGFASARVFVFCVGPFFFECAPTTANQSKGKASRPPLLCSPTGCIYIVTIQRRFFMVASKAPYSNPTTKYYRVSSRLLILTSPIASPSMPLRNLGLRARPSRIAIIFVFIS